MSRLISQEEVKKHDDQKSSWIIIHHEVYDVTKFLDEHPGGADSLLEYAGKDGTQAFEDVAHSDDAREMMKKYKIGAIPVDERKNHGPKCGFVPHLNREFIVLPVSGNDCCEPKNVPKKTWRRFDGGARSKPGEGGGSSGGGAGSGGGSGPSLPTAVAKPCGHCSAPREPGPCGVCAGPQGPLVPGADGHVKAIIVPLPRDSSSTLKWALIALAGAIIIGIAIKKYSG